MAGAGASRACRRPADRPQRRGGGGAPPSAAAAPTDDARGARRARAAAGDGGDGGGAGGADDAPPRRAPGAPRDRDARQRAAAVARAGRGAAKRRGAVARCPPGAGGGAGRRRPPPAAGRARPAAAAGGVCGTAAAAAAAAAATAITVVAGRRGGPAAGPCICAGAGRHRRRAPPRRAGGGGRWGGAPRAPGGGDNDGGGGGGGGSGRQLAAAGVGVAGAVPAVEEGKKRVMVLMSDTGGGHRASAEAIVSALHERYPGRLAVWIVDIFTEIAPPAFHTLPAQYAFFAAHPPLWRAAWEYSRFPPARVATEAVVYALVRRRLRDAYAAYDPDLVLSVHPLCQKLPIRILRGTRRGDAVPFVTVVTDLGGAHPTWFHRGVDRCFVPSPAVAAVARRCGLADAQVRTVGLPVRAAFWEAPGGGGVGPPPPPGVVGAGGGGATDAARIQDDGAAAGGGGGGGGGGEATQLGAASPVMSLLPTAVVPSVLRPAVSLPPLFSFSAVRVASSVGGAPAPAILPKLHLGGGAVGGGDGGGGDGGGGGRRRRPRPPSETSKSRLRRTLDLRPHTPTVLVVGGGDGVGGLAALTTSLTTALAAARGPDGAQVVVVCGRNAGLAASLAARRDWAVPVTVTGLVDGSTMSAWMGAADVLVTKAGPGTIAEALIRGLPMVLSGYLPGQERPNVGYVVDGGAGVFCGGGAPAIGRVVADWVGSPARLDAMAARARAMGRPTATREIAASVGELLFDDADGMEGRGGGGGEGGGGGGACLCKK
ncbi:hypothetical protein BU14_0428s0003 [Porphyra umbilicalis]|uniref:monogalactosyldiacylglycerol synthase n=1 Tax=Porphyra umbilicalis TaxID=2786 RepID=A0A1X6NV47_PORUM|nr:hypothetical protein BU14_0428s0003 [Porphyra umbilicalis]|eukprot:OSX72499.1 hypothetical protein BU14_0428s0003 [Porphyra umbilicalis]